MLLGSSLAVRSGQDLWESAHASPLSFHSPVPSSYFKAHLSRWALCPSSLPLLHEFFSVFVFKMFWNFCTPNRQEIREIHRMNPHLPMT